MQILDIFHNHQSRYRLTTASTVMCYIYRISLIPNVHLFLVNKIISSLPPVLILCTIKLTRYSSCLHNSH
jgi:hypothetical protein